LQQLQDPNLIANLYGQSLTKTHKWTSHPSKVNYELQSKIQKEQLTMNDKAFYLHLFLTNLQKQYKKQSIEMADAFVRFGGDMDAIEYSFKRQ
jgi:hypothetical protein